MKTIATALVLCLCWCWYLKIVNAKGKELVTDVVYCDRQTCWEDAKTLNAWFPDNFAAFCFKWGDAECKDCVTRF